MAEKQFYTLSCCGHKVQLLLVHCHEGGKKSLTIIESGVAEVMINRLLL